MAHAALVDRGGGLIYDTDLNVTWLQDTNYAKTSGFRTNGKMTWNTAMSWAAALSYYDSIRNITWTDWRLPAAPGNIELKHEGEMSHLYYTELGNTEGGPLSNMGPFAATLSAGFPSYWSGNANITNSSEGVYFYFGAGIYGSMWTIGDETGLYAMAVRDGDVGAPVPTIQLPQTGQTKCYDTVGAEIACIGTGQDGEIRAGAAWPSSRFTSGTDGEVECMIDNLTGLMWPKNGNLAGGTKTWNNAIDYANNLTLCGHDDWRLPNVNELESLVDASEPNLAFWLNAQGFTAVQSDPYWSSTTSLAYGTGTDYAWFFDMLYGGAYSAPLRRNMTTCGQFAQDSLFHPVILLFGRPDRPSHTVPETMET
ncbi:MAG: DUF1566 domain-containing protein [Deltaproteobacteria bacterium]